jgi:DNA mismatch endonuclease (patch repair protein)
LNFLGWTVIHFWGKDILKNTEDCIKLVEEVIFDIKLGEIQE